jgi:hypothetical protein
MRVKSERSFWLGIPRSLLRGEFISSKDVAEGLLTGNLIPSGARWAHFGISPHTDNLCRKDFHMGDKGRLI